MIRKIGRLLGRKQVDYHLLMIPVYTYIKNEMGILHEVA